MRYRGAAPQRVVDMERMSDTGAALCRKARYRNKRVARTQAGRAGSATGMTYNLYRCEACGWWHLTTHPLAKGTA